MKTRTLFFDRAGAPGLLGIGLICLLLSLPAPLLGDEVRPPDYSSPSRAGGGGPHLMRLTAAQGAGMLHVRAMQSIARAIERNSGGAIRTELLIDGRGGSEAEALKSLIRGRIEGGFLSAATLAHSLPAFHLLSIPRLFTEADQVRAFIGSPLEGAMRATAENKGLRVLGYGSYGFYGILGFRQGGAENPQAALSLIDLPVRTPSDEWLNRVYSALPLRTLRVPVGDLAEAMASGWVQGIAATPESITQTRLAASATAYFNTRIMHGWTVFMVSQTWLSTLPSALQDVVTGAVSAHTAHHLELALAAEEDILAGWSRQGAPRIVVLAPGDLATLLRPLALGAAGRVERILGRPRAVHRLWENNHNPSAADRVGIERSIRSPTPPTTSRVLRRTPPGARDSLGR